MIWGTLPKSGTAPPTGHEICKIAILANNFWTLCQKIIILVSMDSLHHAEYLDINFAMMGCTTCPPFWILSYFEISFKIFEISSPKLVWIIISISQRYLRSLITAPPSVPEILLFFEKTLITFANIAWNLIPLCQYIPWVMPISTISHMLFSNNVTGRHIGANVKQFFRYSSFKFCPIFSKHALKWSSDWAA